MVPEEETNKPDEQEQTPDEKAEELLKQTKEELKEGGVSTEHLEALRKELTEQIHTLGTAHAQDKREREELGAKFTDLLNRVEDMIQRQEEKDRVKSDESTMLVPPPELDPPTHQNETLKEDTTPENTQEKKPRKGLFKIW